MKDISIITVTWNSREHIGKQIESVASGCHEVSFEHIIVDNGSKDATAQYVAQNYPELTVIANPDNSMGFGKANNQGVEKSTGEFLLFLNPDMRVEERSLDTIVAWMREHRDVGIVSPKLVDQHGKLNPDATPRRFPRLWEQIAIILKLPHLFPNMLNEYHMKAFDAEREQEVDSVRGSFMLMRREIVERLGWAWDPRYFIWYEDVDICREVKRLGMKVMYTPAISCADYVGQSFKKRKLFWKQNVLTKSMLTYFQKWEPWYKWIWIALLRPLTVGAAWVHDVFVRERK